MGPCWPWYSWQDLPAIDWPEDMVPVYLGLAWIGVISAIPLAGVTPSLVLALLGLGGVLYSAGVLFYLNKRLQFAKAIWHGHVVVAAAAHWGAVLVGVCIAGATAT